MNEYEGYAQSFKWQKLEEHILKFADQCNVRVTITGVKSGILTKTVFFDVITSDPQFAMAFVQTLQNKSSR